MSSVDLDNMYLNSLHGRGTNSGKQSFPNNVRYINIGSCDVSRTHTCIGQSTNPESVKRLCLMK